MAEMYETLQTQTKQTKYMKYLTLVVVVLFLTLVGVVVYILVDQPTCVQPDELCTSPHCVSLANEVLASINTSVDPCEDFYHYSCDGWISRNAWRLVDDGEYSQFGDVQEMLKKNFLDEMFWYENPTLIDPAPVDKAKTFFDTCYKSTTTRDDLAGSNLLKQFISKVNFSNENSKWEDDGVSTQFSEAIAWLNQREWNTLFSMSVYYENDVLLQQNSDFWSTYNENNTKFCETVNKTFLPLFMEIYDVNSSLSGDWWEDACEISEEINRIGVYPDDYLNVNTKYGNYFTNDNFSNLKNLVPDSLALNLTEIIYKTFRSKDVELVYHYGDPDIIYLNSLSEVLLNDSSPFSVQLYIFANVLWYYLDFEDSWQDTQDISRRDFCYQWTLDQFPFVFGYITGNTLYSDEKFQAVSELVGNVQNDGILDMIKNADWLDDDSRAAAQQKAELMKLYIGYPESVSDANAITKFYKDVGDMDDKVWLTNVERVNDWYANLTVGSFSNNVYEILDDWPIIFSQKDVFRFWLTGVNAFYYPGPAVDGANFFTIPATISQEPFFNPDFPSAVNYGGLGSVCGHEMSHGFDPNGFTWSWNGTDLLPGSILSDANTNTYFDKIDCYIDQYNALPVRRNDDLLDNGTRTQTENVADNAGLRASYLAWQAYKSGDGANENTLLPGIDFTETQLFFWSWAHLWCDVNRPDVYQNYTNEHSPHWTRVIGSLQNSPEFQEAFSCDNNDFMSPASKCTLW